MAKSTIEDSKAIARAEQGTNQLDRDGSQEGQPEMGSGTPAHKANASQAGGAGTGIPAKGKKKSLRAGVQKKAHDYNTRSQNGNAETTGGGNGAE